jgi:hypothetical protein
VNTQAKEMDVEFKLTELLHRAGINVRYFGLVRISCTFPLELGTSLSFLANRFGFIYGDT